jgi:hypothetical protein
MDNDCRRPLKRPRPKPRAAAAAALAALTALAAIPAAAPAARADDRSLLHATQQSPYVFIILDTSGSMHQEVNCSAADIAAGICTTQCDNGNCLPRMMGDDPDSKIYVAKQAIYNIMQSHPNVNFGFGHFDQGALRVIYKYWYYRVASTQASGFITLDDGTQFPGAGQEELFGEPDPGEPPSRPAWTCTNDNGGSSSFGNIGCFQTSPAHLDNAWEWERMRRYPKLGDANNRTFSYYFTQLGNGSKPTYKITFSPVAGQVLGATPLLANISVDKCLDATCSGAGHAVNKGNKVMTWNLANPTIYWEPPFRLNGANAPAAADAGTGGDFYGWPTLEVFLGDRSYPSWPNDYSRRLEPNNDTPFTGATGDDSYCSGSPNNCIDLLQPTTADSLGRGPGDTFSIGDRIPLDWTTNQQILISQRMAPNLIANPSATPNFGIATYMADHRVNGEQALRLLNAQQRPLMPEGGTPTGQVMMSFGNWLTGNNWPASSWNSQASGTSWVATASASNGDPFFACKHIYVLLLTDGLASSDDGTFQLDTSVCPTYAGWASPQSFSKAPGFACCAAEALRTITYGASKTPLAVRTFTIGLGLSTTNVGGYNNTLQCVTDMGGTGNRHFFNGNPNTVGGQPAGYPASDPPAAGFCSATNTCDGPGPILPRNKNDIQAALQTILDLISSQETAFASAAVPSIQSNVQNKELITSFLPINQPIWPGRVDAFTDPVPTQSVTVTLPDGTTATASVPDTRPSAACTSPGQQGCHLWNAGGGQLVNGPPAGDTILAQALIGYDTSTSSADPTKRRVYYAPATPIVAGERRLFFQMPLATDTGHLNDLENALGLCGPGYSFYPPSTATCTENSTPVGTECTNIPASSSNPCPSGQTTAAPPYSTAQQAITFTESIKSYQDPATKQPIQYILGDIFHSDPQVLGQPNNSTLFNGNVDNYQAFAGAERFRRKVLYFGSNDGQLHALDVGTVQQGTSAGQAAWVFGNGTGNELFSFIPRTVMPTLNQLAIASTLSGGGQTFMVDGPPHLAEGFFDATGGSSPVWHSLVIGGLREGGHGYYAVDVTQPDTLQSNFETPNVSTTAAIQLPNPSPPNYLPNCINGGSGCGQLAYATPLWEFTDSCKVVPTCTINCQLKPCDEEPATPVGPWIGQPDLGEAWSRANSGRVRICDTSGCSTFHEQWVVVFGGGMDPAANNSQGNWLYMLDMATGKVIYKQQLNGSVPSEPAAVDTGQDGYIDTIYIGTTAGHLYKVDLTQGAPIDSATGRVTTGFWKPFEIFDTQGRAIFYPPAVFFDADLNRYGLAWGTGNRFDLWKNDATTGRFYVMIDTGFTAANTPTPLNVGSLQQLTPDGALNPTSNFLLNPAAGKQPGYFFELAAGERVINQAFALSGVLLFGSYIPKPITSAVSSNTVCANTGDTHVFVLNIDNGDAISSQLAAEGTGTPANGPTGGPTNRYFVLIKDLGLNINTSESTPIIATATNPNPPQPPGPSAALKDMIKKISGINSQSCRYSNKLINITVTDTFNTTYPAAAVPVCIIEKNWKEF